MTLNLSLSQERDDLKPRITVFGVGGAGGNAVNNMIDKLLDGVEFVVANTDAQALQQSRSANRVQMGVKVTEGLGAGARPQVGAAAAEETIEEIVDHLAGAHMCFITAGMGGGTGTGAAPIIAQAARELGVLTVGVVTKPFQFEGAKRMRLAEDGIEALQRVVDTLIVIPNQNLFRLANERTTFTEAFAMADDVLYQGVKGVTDLMVRPGLINLDFADVRSVMDEMGKAMMGTGEAEGEDRAVQAAEKAIANPLLDEISLNGARGVLINITGGYDMTLFELDEAANIIRDKVDPEANIIVGSTLDTEMEGHMRVSVVATGIDIVQAAETQPAKPAAAATTETRREPPVAAHEPRPAAARAPDPQPEPAAVAEPAAEPEPAGGLFDAAAYERAEPAAPVAEEVPAPAYRPQPQMQPAAEPARPARAPAAQAPAQVDDDIDPSAFIPPRPRVAGQPSPEAMKRLQAAASRQPPAATAREAQPAPAPKPAERRFGIGNLINRMAGAPEGGALAPTRAQQPPVSHYDDEPEASADQERIEIPAFLRRQAN